MYLYPIADRIENIHFLVAQTEADLTDEHNLCSVYPGPPEAPVMINDDVVWFPCPLKKGRYFKIISYTSTGHLTVREVEMFGYSL